jgi:hypothetical protein
MLTTLSRELSHPIALGVPAVEGQPPVDHRRKRPQGWSWRIFQHDHEEFAGSFSMLLRESPPRIASSLIWPAASLTLLL